MRGRRASAARFLAPLALLLCAGCAAAPRTHAPALPAPPLPAGWKSERWQAGFGSWAYGGEGVAYDIQMPAGYDFSQKCGIAWIADDIEGPEFALRLSFLTEADERRQDFEYYLRDDATQWYERHPPIVYESPRPLDIASQPSTRRGFRLTGVTLLQDEAKSVRPKTGTATGFWIEGNTLSIIADLRDPARAAIDERIVRSIRPASGYGMADLQSGRIPGLLGC